MNEKNINIHYGLCIEKKVTSNSSVTKVTNETQFFAFITKKTVSFERKYIDDYIISPYSFMFIDQEDIDFSNIFISFEEKP